MPRYYLHFEDGGGRCFDELGQDLADDEAARTEATTGLRDILADQIRSGALDKNSRIEVDDGNGRRIFVVGFDDAIHHIEQ